MLPPGGSICRILTSDLPLGCLQGGVHSCWSWAWPTKPEPIWEGFRESRRCSRDTYPHSYITECTSVYQDFWESSRNTILEGTGSWKYSKYVCFEYLSFSNSILRSMIARISDPMCNENLYASEDLRAMGQSYLTHCINSMVLDSQLPHKIVHLLF